MFLHSKPPALDASRKMRTLNGLTHKNYDKPKLFLLAGQVKRYCETLILIFIFIHAFEREQSRGGLLDKIHAAKKTEHEFFKLFKNIFKVNKCTPTSDHIRLLMRI